MVCLCDNILKEDPYFLKLDKNFTSMPTMVDEQSYDKMNLIRELYKKNRVLVSDGFNESLRHIRNYIPLRYYDFPTGMSVWTWKIPKKWIFKEAYIINSNTGKKIVDTKHNLLHIHINFCPVDREVNHDELIAHLSYRKELPEAIPYHEKYYREDWGFSIKAKEIKKFNSDKYRIKIESEITNGHLIVGDYTVKGYTDDTIIFPIHLDHPWQCNDNLSGCVIVIELIKRLHETSDLRYSYKFLFLPETIGIIAFLATHEEILPYIKYGIVIDSVDSEGPLKLTRTKDSISLLNDYAIYAMEKIASIDKVYEFFDDEYLSSANDERILQAPSIEIPSIHISRAPFKEYHSSLDTPDIILEEKLNETFEILCEIIRIIEKDYRPKQNYKGILCLSEYNLYDLNWTLEDNLAIEKILHSLNEESSMFEIDKKVGRDFDFVFEFIKKLNREGLVSMN